MNQQTTQQNQTSRKTTGRTSWRYLTKRQRKNRRRIDRLAEYWPDLFNTDPIKPIIQGVIHDMLQEVKARELPIGPGVLRGALTSYIHTTRYLKAIVAGGARYDLKGQPCGEVTQEEQAVATGILEQRLVRITRENSRQQPEGGEASDNGQCGTEP